MKFIKLEILNLASLDRQGGETINFEEGALGESTIFSIVGPTGSGKSTILDAICLALYNRAPRYPRKKGDRNQNIEIFGELEESEKNRLAPTDSRNILTRGKKEGFSKLTFLANNGDVYRAEWWVRKLTKNYENARTFLYKITQKDGNLTEEQVEWEKLPRIIGLDYEQFLRTVLIAQGSFANFLTAKENERYELLEKLIGCEEMYVNIATKIKLQKDEAVKAYDQIAANLSAQEKDIIPEEELSALRVRIAELEAIEKQTKEELLKVSEAIAWYTTNEKHVDNITKYERAFIEVKQKREAQREQAERLALHDATMPATSLYKEITTAEASILHLEETLKRFKDSIAKYEQELKQEVDVNLAKLKQEAEKSTYELEQQKPHINKAREIKAELEGLKRVLNEKKTAKADAKKGKEKADKEVLDNEKVIEKVTADLRNAVEAKNRLRTEIEAEKAMKTGALALIEVKIAEEKAKIANIDIEQLNADVEALLRTYTLMTSENWEEHRSLLKEGEPCPLCGGTHHPYANQNVFNQVENELSLKLKDKQQQQKDYNQAKQLLDQLNAQKDTANTAILNYAEEVQKKMERADKQVTDANTLLETEKGKTANLKAQQAEKKEALANAETMLTRSAEEVATKLDALKQELGDKDPDAYERALTDTKNKADNAVKEKIESIASIREQLTEVMGKETATKAQMEKESKTRHSKQQELVQWLSDYNANNPQQLTEESIAQLYSSTDDWEDIRSRQKRLSETYTSAETTLNNEKKAQLEHQQKRPEQEKETLLARKAELEGMANTELVDAKARLQRHETAKRQMGAMFGQKQEAEQLKTEWCQIADAIGGDGKTLRKMAQCYTLRFLVEHANVEIRKFNSRYELLQVKNSLGIRVIDHDRADDVRDTTSLSGGETFIVSLGLALGLSALSSRNIRFENLFIDEGFGTLDPDTLDHVIDSLAMLQTSQGKRVGVISHTDTMCERIATQIRIVKNGNSGSSHIEIYP
ncbi:MAG: hypothetical protein MJZ35_07325 [Bacteroidaceae bacterium]|nr:hypothetical protein [Bacteroidaceae bacterium]